MWIHANLLCKLVTKAAKHPAHPNILPSKHPTDPHIGWQPPQKFQATGIDNLPLIKTAFILTQMRPDGMHVGGISSPCVFISSPVRFCKKCVCVHGDEPKSAQAKCCGMSYRFQKVVHECAPDYLEFIDYFMCHGALGTQARVFADIFMMAWCLQLLAVGQNHARQIWAPPSNRSELESHNLHCIQMWGISSLDLGLDNSHLSRDYTSTSKLYRIYGQQPYDSWVFHISKTSAWRHRLHEHSDGPKDPSKLSNGPT